MLALPLLALVAVAAPGPRPDSGARVLHDDNIIVLDADAGAELAVPGLQRFASSSDSVQVTRAGRDTLSLRAQGLGGTQLDAWVDGGAHLRARIFVHPPNGYPDLGVDFLPLTHAHDIQVRNLDDKATVIRAHLAAVEDAVALELLAESHPRVILLAGLSTSAVDHAMRTLNAGLPSGVHAVWAGDRVVIRGRAGPDALHAAEKRADTQLGLLANAVRGGRIYLEPEERGGPRMRVVLGGQRVIAFPSGIDRVAVADPAIADVKPVAPDQLLLVGAAEGSTRLEVWARDGSVQQYRISVEDYDGDGWTDPGLSALVPRHRSIGLKMVGDRIFVAGKLTTLEQALATADVLRAMPNLLLLDPPSEAVLDAQVRAVNAGLLQSGVTSLRAVRTGWALSFEGEPRDPTDLAIAQGWSEALYEPFARLPRKLTLPQMPAAGP